MTDYLGEACSPLDAISAHTQRVLETVPPDTASDQVEYRANGARYIFDKLGNTYTVQVIDGEKLLQLEFDPVDPSNLMTGSIITPETAKIDEVEYEKRDSYATYILKCLGLDVEVV